jgi:hypothetical protein
LSTPQVKELVQLVSLLESIEIQSLKSGFLKQEPLFLPIKESALSMSSTR